MHNGKSISQVFEKCQSDHRGVQHNQVIVDKDKKQKKKTEWKPEDKKQNAAK